ncbi:hypothetical protein [Brachybacterium hainanense]|uniref:Uncharacterized protein n=1 Tax=Brachybacterium hainanense TaxID=1541174 RepID=A0ABV6RCB8_9MICO
MSADDHLPTQLFPIMTPIACTECGKTMPVKTIAWIPGWGQIAHWDPACPEAGDDWEDA